MPDPILHYHSWTVVTAKVATSSDRSEVPRGVSVASTHSLQSGNSSLGAWGPRIADEDLDEVIERLYPQRELDMAGQRQRGSKRPSDQDRVARLQQKFAKIGDGNKSRAGPSASALAKDSRPRDPFASISGAEPIRRKTSTQRAIVSKFDDRLTSEVAECSRHSDHVQASEDMIKKLVEVVCLAFSGNATTRGCSNSMEEKVASLDSEVRKGKHAEKVALEKEGMRDMKASFVMSNPTMTGADWSFMPKISKETAAEEIEAAQGGTEKGEMTGGEQVVEDVVVIDKPENDSSSTLVGIQNRDLVHGPETSRLLGTLSVFRGPLDSWDLPEQTS
ncbi:hypothetical protein TIFTF001_027132 [Ficus carica]|uniref:Uncharacterized protein n=1 Tax=Ficus carica TaxID=3494 RepID=A0AA88DMJ9_FICCA|nr:hypothetical protein TIFTF001_027132 [Ficus carica]